MSEIISDKEKVSTLTIIKAKIKELLKYPIEGIGIGKEEDNFFNYVVNIKIMKGIFEGYFIQMLIKFSLKFPILPPTVLIYPDQNIVFYLKFMCLSDIIYNDNYFYKFESESLWTSDCNLRILLLKIQNYLNDPYIDVEFYPNKAEIDKLMESMDSYRNFFIVNNELIEHTWKNPYPKIYSKNNKDKTLEFNIEDFENYIKHLKLKKQKIMNFQISKKIDNLNYKEKIELLKKYLSCKISKTNYYENCDNNIYGYIITNIKNEKMIPSDELISFEAFKSLKNKPNNNFVYNSKNCFFMPIYINSIHFIFVKIEFLYEDAAFLSQNYLEILQAILYSKMLELTEVKNINKKSSFSSSIICLFHYILLFKKIIKIYKKEYKQYLNKNLKICEINNIPKIVPFIIKLFIIVLFNNDPHSTEMKKISKYIKLLKEKEFLNRFYTTKDYKMKDIEKFKEDLYKCKIFDKIIEIIISNKSIKNNGKISKNFRKKIISKFSEMFKELYMECNLDFKNKIDILILDQIAFSDYFEEKDLKINYKDYLDLIMVLFVIKKQITEKKFFHELEDNDGVYLQWNDFFEEILRVLKNIKYISELKRYIKIENFYKKISSDFSIIEIYEKEKINSNLKNNCNYLKYNSIKYKNEIKDIQLQKVIEIGYGINNNIIDKIEENKEIMICSYSSSYEINSNKIDKIEEKKEFMNNSYTSYENSYFSDSDHSENESIDDDNDDNDDNYYDYYEYKFNINFNDYYNDKKNKKKKFKIKNNLKRKKELEE